MKPDQTSLTTTRNHILKREAWAKGTACAKARVSARERAFSSALDALLTRTAEEDEAVAAAERKRAAEKAAASSTVWMASRFAVPVQRLKELMEQKMEESRSSGHPLLRSGCKKN